MTLILGIESSCDETAAAVVQDGRAVRSSIIASQNDLHQRYGGVVPEIASRAHLERILPVINESLLAAGVNFSDLDAIAVGNRPGLIGSLLIGVSAAKTLAWSLGKPLMGIDHVQAHLYAGTMAFPGKEATVSGPQPSLSTLDALFPALGLVVSGGHTSLYEMRSPTEMTVLGRTIDDAVGEAYDKAAVILDVGYPGGPRLDKLAQTAMPGPDDSLPRSLLDKTSLDFSFSGLKTAILYKVRGHPVGRGEAAHFERSNKDLTDARRAQLCGAFQQAVVDTLIIKIKRALDMLAARGTPARSLLVGGGVSANSLLRKRALELGDDRNITVRVPPMALCLDNAAMIAGLAHEYFVQNRFDDLHLPAIATSGR